MNRYKNLSVEALETVLIETEMEQAAIHKEMIQKISELEEELAYQKAVKRKILTALLSKQIDKGMHKCGQKEGG